MKSHFLTRALAILLTVVLVTPSVFLIAPQRARAAISVTEIGANLLTNIKTTFETTITAIKSVLTEVNTATTAWATTAQQINTYILQPLAFVLSGNLLKMITASVISFVIGAANGTGAPQFVQDLQGNLQRVGDVQASAFFIQFGRNSNSPFASAITSSLRTHYLQNTSSAGFFAANRSTLARSSPNINSFLAGNWSQGGVGAWFALTTQTQNNPYTFYQASQSQLASVVAGATGARLAELNWGQGFLSWCGPADAGGNAVSPGGTAEGDIPAGQETFGDDYGSGYEAQYAANPEYQAASAGVKSGDPCFYKNGVPGTIKTPGSTIKAALDSALGSTQRKLEGMGSLAKEVGQILNNVGTIMSTVQFATQLLGGSDSGGLAGIGQTSGTNSTSRLAEFQGSSGYLGVTSSQVYQNAATLPVSGSFMLNRVVQYESAWNTIRSAANAASTTVAGLATFCTAAATTATNSSFASTATAQAATAQTAITTQVAPVLVQADAASVAIAAARAMVQKIQNELNSGIDTTSSVYLADIQTLQTMAPTTSDLANALQEVEAFNQATAIPAGSLTVTGGSTIDRMALIATNAVALKTSVCTEQINFNSGGG